jgi:hypothetical protein
MALSGLAMSLAALALPDFLGMSAGSVSWIGLIPFTAGCLGLILSEMKRGSLAVNSMGFTVPILMAGVFGVLLPRIDRCQNTPSILAHISSKSRNDAWSLAEFGLVAPSLSFYAKNRVERCQTPQDVARYFQSRQVDSYLVTTERKWQQVRERMPSEAQVLRVQRRFLRNESILLVFRPGSISQAIAEASPADHGHLSLVERMRPSLPNPARQSN